MGVMECLEQKVTREKLVCLDLQVTVLKECLDLLAQLVSEEKRAWLVDQVAKDFQGYLGRRVSLGASVIHVLLA